jgi:SAP domain-containing ribonucleoprotein
VSKTLAADRAPVPKRPLEAPKPSSLTTAKPLPNVAPTDVTDAEAALAIELEKRKRRAERFGIPLEESAKSIERAKRFGTTTPTTEESKKEARGKRFGNQVSSENKDAKKLGEASTPKPRVLDDPAEAEKARKRAERFGGGSDAKKIKT